MTKRSMFIIGSNAAARAGNCSARYVCPLCRRSFFEDDPKVLTEEHVPAKSLGGKSLVLTCVACNNEAGSLLQGHQKEKDTQERFWAGKLDKNLNNEIETSLGIMRGEGTYNPDTNNVEFKFDPNRMNPSVTTALVKNSKNLTYTSFQVGKKYDNHKARIADLRDAYLWIFARFGYTAIAMPWLDWAREAIKHGSTSNQKWAINLDDPITKEAQQKLGRATIFFLIKPKGALLVCNGKSGVIFPTIFNPDPYSLLDDDKAHIVLGQRFEPVPEIMQMGMDFSELLYPTS